MKNWKAWMSPINNNIAPNDLLIRLQLFWSRSFSLKLSRPNRLSAASFPKKTPTKNQIPIKMLNTTTWIQEFSLRNISIKAPKRIAKVASRISTNEAAIENWKPFWKLLLSVIWITERFIAPKGIAPTKVAIKAIDKYKKTELSK